MKFRLNESFIVDTAETPWRTEGLRVGIFGGSGSGKSNTAALLAEQFLSQSGTVVVFEPRAEYHTLKEKWDLVVCGGPYGKDIDFSPTSPATYAKAVVEHGVSIVFYTSDVDDETKLIDFTTRFINYLLKYNEVAKRPIKVICEETHEYAPSSTRGRVSPPWVFSRLIKAFKTLSVDARKLNIVPVYLSPRPQEVNFTIRQLCNLTFYGKFSAQDSEYVDRECLKPLREHGGTLRGSDLIGMPTGQFYAVYERTIQPVTVTEPRQTKHGAETPTLTVVAERREETKKAVESLTKAITDALAKERTEESELEKAKRQVKGLAGELAEARAKIGDLEQSAKTLGLIRIEQPKNEGANVKEDPEKEILKDRAYNAEMRLSKIREVLAPDYFERARTCTTALDLWNAWKDKLPNPMTSKIFKFLVDHAEAKYSKTEIAAQLAYSSRTSGVGTALSWLVRNSLIKRMGDYYQAA